MRVARYMIAFLGTLAAGPVQAAQVLSVTQADLPQPVVELVGAIEKGKPLPLEVFSTEPSASWQESLSDLRHCQREEHAWLTPGQELVVAWDCGLPVRNVRLATFIRIADGKIKDMNFATSMMMSRPAGPSLVLPTSIQTFVASIMTGQSPPSKDLEEPISAVLKRKLRDLEGCGFSDDATFNSENYWSLMWQCPRQDSDAFTMTRLRMSGDRYTVEDVADLRRETFTSPEPIEQVEP